EAIAIQGNSSTGISIVEENHNFQIKQAESTEGRKTKQDNVEKAVVPYK
ncbi:COP1-interacting-like protein, partial [Trifolium medium]|nr:COP1-interacting-like protein [Trifolium medium]